MSMRNSVIEYLDQRPQLKSLAKSGVLQTSRAYHAVIETFPSLLQPAPRQLTMAITAKCNLGCKGCNYPNNGFMGGVTLPLTRRAFRRPGSLAANHCYIRICRR
jgi:hypothetical protein